MKRQTSFERIVIHHSASPLSTTVEDIRGWHKSRGFEDIGYAYVIHEDGTVRIGRPVLFVGAHAKGANEGSIGVCVVGDNTKPDQSWTAAQKRELRELVYRLQVIFGPLAIYGHSTVPGGETATECPGVDLATVL